MSTGRAGAPSRQQQAFRWLLEGDGEPPGDQSRRQQRAGGGGSGGGTKGAAAAGKRRSASSGGGGGKSYLPGFQLRADAAAATAAEAAQGSSAGGTATDELAALQEAFAEVLPPDVVADVLASCGGNADAAMAALRAMAGVGEAAGPPAASSSQQHQRQQQQCQQTQQQRPVGPCHWNTLPAHLTHQMFEQLSLR